MKTRNILALLSFLLIFSACSGPSYMMGSYDEEAAFDQSYGLSSAPRVMGEMMDDYESYESGYKSADYSVVTNNGGYVEGVQQKVIKTGNLSLHVEDVRESVDAVKAKVMEWGGDTDSSSVNRYDNYYVAYLTVRVPSEKFTDAMAGLKEFAVYVNSEDTNAQNVTEAYMDLQARLVNLKAEEQNYLEILDQAVTVEETLQVTSALSNVRYQIESMEGQIRYYDSTIDYSTINLTLTEDESISAAKETWRPVGTVREALSDWVVFLQDLADRGIYLLIFGWPLVLLGLGAWFWLRRGKRRK